MKVKPLKNPLIVLLILLLFLNVILTALIILTHVHTNGIFTSLSEIDKGKVSYNYQIYRIETLVNNTFLQMTPEEKVGQLFMVSINGGYINDSIRSLIEEYHIGGVVIMSGNITGQEQLKQLINDMRNTSDTPLLIATDQEGGVVARIPWDNARYISQPHIGIVNREDFAYETGVEHALALKNFGIDMNLAPVLDVSFITGSAMSSRTLGASPKKVSELGIQIIKAHEDNGIIATAKHFPGIGRTTTDSHYALPVLDISKEQLGSEELIPFKTAIENDIDVIMTGHAFFPQIDGEYPSSLSTVFLTDILRGELGFDGVIISDDLNMSALRDYPNKAVDAIHAGTDIILIVDSYENQVTYIDQVKKAVDEGTISEKQITNSVKRILRLKYKKI
ncbi:beta-N-acetylhexosaminidase [Candidatus Dojkabacteria bacterium]|nr:beta-N-acetylhexosaminidase [Candidatus Dojkabacteria bacterium]